MNVNMIVQWVDGGEIFVCLKMYTLGLFLHP